jgi:hypothetical protein
VHALPSSQFAFDPGVQAPLTQTSPVVQALPSLQGPATGRKTQIPVAVSQLSSVQTLKSVQDRRGPELQEPFEQKSDTVHGLPSLQEPKLFGWTQAPVAGSH